MIVERIDVDVDKVLFDVNRWAELREVAEKKKEGLQLAHDVNTFHIECQETAVRRQSFLSPSYHYFLLADNAATSYKE